MFALRHTKTGNLLGVSGTGNDPESESTGVSYELNEWGNNVWVVTDRHTAETVAHSISEWYNATYDSPENPFVGKCEVVELKVK